MCVCVFMYVRMYEESMHVCINMLICYYVKYVWMDVNVCLYVCMYACKYMIRDGIEPYVNIVALSENIIITDYKYCYGQTLNRTLLDCKGQRQKKLNKIPI